MFNPIRFNLIGLAVLSGLLIPVESSAQFVVSASQKVELAVFGNNDWGTSYEFNCPSMHTIGVIDVNHGWHHLGHNGDYVNGVRFGCSEFLPDGSMDNGLVMQSQLGYPNIFGNSNGTTIYRDCYPYQWTGIHGRTGQWVDQLGGYCGDIDDILAGEHDPARALAAVGGNGGSPNERECPAGYIPTGAKVTVLNGGNYIQGIELICSRVDDSSLDSDFDGVADAEEPICANNPDELCYLRELQHNAILDLIAQSLGGLTGSQIAQADDDARLFFANSSPQYSCTGWADYLEAEFGVASLALGTTCSDFDGDGVPDASDEYPTIYSWSCDYPDNGGASVDNSKCEANYSRIKDIYLSIHGTDSNPDLFSSMWSHYLDFASGQSTCIDVLEQEAADAGVAVEPHYVACASDQSRRSAQIISSVCDATSSSSIYSPERCRLGKSLYQFVSPSSFAVQAEAKWWEWIIGRIDFVAKNDFTCYTDSKFTNPALGPEVSAYSNSLCFNGNDPNENTIFVGNEPLYGRSETLIEQIQPNHEHTYVQWDYTYEALEAIGYILRRLEPVDVAQPVLVDKNYSFENPTSDAMEMDVQSCWRSGKNILGYNDQGSCDETYFTVTDVRPGGDDWYYDNTITPVAQFYSQPSGFFDGGFMLNRCRVKTEYDSWLDYLSGAQSQLPSNLANYSYEYSCSIDSEQLNSLITSELITDEAERVGMYQALIEVGMMAISNVVGLAGAAKFATAGTKLAKAVNYATRAWEGIEASLEVASIAAQVYVLAAEDIPACRQLKGTAKEACFAQTLGGTLVSLASAVGEDQLYSRSASFMDEMSRQVPNDGQTLPDDTFVTNQIYTEGDFRGQIEATRQLVEANQGVADVHHQVWNAAGVDLPGLLIELNTAGESTLGSNLNSALYDLPPQVRELSAFKDKVVEIFNDDKGLGTVEKSTKLLDMANGFSTIAGDLSDTDLRALDSMSQADFELFVELVSNPGGATWTNQTPRQFLDSFKQPVTGGVCYLG